MQGYVGDSVDRIITVEMRPAGVPCGVIPDLYSRIRSQVGESLTLRAARRLLALPSDATVFIATGAGAEGVLPKGETDGPPGAAALCRVLTAVRAARPIVLTTAGYEEPMAAALEAYESRAEIVTMSAAASADDATAIARDWIRRYKPAAAIATEMKGVAADGKLHFMTGRECAVDARLDRVFVLARSLQIATIGIGDGGNEIGFGAFRDDVRSAHPEGATIASTIATDETVVAAISNWGCYGVEAMIAFLVERPDLLHSADMGVRGLEACAAAGAGDGIFTRQLAFEDGQPGTVHAALVTMLRQIISNGSQTIEHALRRVATTLP